MKNKYELLAPVGNFAMLHAAIDAKADAVFLGLKEFNMRDNANNFSIQDLKKAKKICEENKVKLYLTLNVIIFEEELRKIEQLFKKIKGNVDAIICWDLSVIQLCKKYKIPFHISTQASISNSESANFYKKLGAERIVLARELSLKQILEIKKRSKMEIECFCHGAMCVSISGRCFTSQFLHGLSANRGQCAHPCRREYTIKEVGSENELKLQNNRVMSAKDLCTLPFIEKMKKAGITSFK
jgi:putative protease